VRASAVVSRCDGANWGEYAVLVDNSEGIQQPKHPLDDTSISVDGPLCRRPGRAWTSLCHGLAGNADVLLEGTQVPGQGDDHPGAALPEAVADLGGRHYLIDGGGPWPLRDRHRRSTWPHGRSRRHRPFLPRAPRSQRQLRPAVEVTADEAVRPLTQRPATIIKKGDGHPCCRGHRSTCVSALVRLLQAESPGTAGDRGVRGLEVRARRFVSPSSPTRSAAAVTCREDAHGEDQVGRRIEAVLRGAEFEAWTGVTDGQDGGLWTS
jgi:hypothetical protein